MTDAELWLVIDQIKGGNCSVEEIGLALLAAEHATERAKRLRRAVDEALLRHVRAHGATTIGVVTYYAGYRTTTKPIERAGVLDALLTNASGDLEAVASLLIAQPFRCAAVRGALPMSVFSSLFRVEQHVKLGQTLKKFDSRFARTRQTPECLDLTKFRE